MGRDCDSVDVLVAAPRSCLGLWIPWAHRAIAQCSFRSNPHGASHVGHHRGRKGRAQPLAGSASSACCSAALLVANPFEGSARQPAQILSQFSRVATSSLFHGNAWNSGELSSPPAYLSVVLIFLGLLPRASRQGYRKLPSNLSLFKWFLTRWPQSHISDIHLHSLAMTTVIEPKSFTVSN